MCLLMNHRSSLYKDYKIEIKGKSANPNPTGNKKTTKT